MAEEKLTGADALVSTLADNGLEACFANPGTSEMHFVAALDSEPRMRAYVKRRTQEGHSTKEIYRCLKRYIAREVFSIITRRQKEISQTRSVA